MFYGNKSSIDFRKKPMHAQKGSETFIDNTMHKDMKYSRVNSPNSRFRFIPSIDIVWGGMGVDRMCSKMNRAKQINHDKMELLR